MAIGYIGLGNMGGAVALRLQASAPLVVYDRNPQAMQRLVEAGATPAASASEVARQCATILLCLPDSKHVHAVIFGDQGIATAARAGTLIVDQSTGDPLATRAMAVELLPLGIELIDAPVSGGPRGAAAGTLSIMVGASTEQYRRVAPMLRAISAHLFHAGEVGNGQVIKLANNLLHHTQRLLSLEVLALAVKNGVEPATAVDILLASSGRNYYLEQNMASRVLIGNLISGFTLDLLHKDVRLATELGNDSGVPLFFGNLAREFYQKYRNELGGETQVNAVALAIDRMAGTRIVPPDYKL